MKYILSKYVDKKIINENIYLFNYKNGEDCFLKSSDFVESFDLSPGKSIYTDLIKKGFYVRNDLDEFKILNHNANIEIYGSDTFELTIIPTDACNFSCQYCYQDGQPHIMNDYGSLFNYIKFTLKKVKLLIINWFGGEPLICGQNIVEFMKKVKQECKSNNVLLYSTITTNGSLLSYDLFCELTKVGIFYYQITLDGLEKTHNSQRPLKDGGNSFKLILNNLKMIRDKSLLSFVQIVIRVNLSASIYGEFKLFLEFYKKEFGKDRRFILYIEKVQDWGGEKINNFSDEILLGENEYISAWDLAIKSNINLPQFFKYNHRTNICSASREHGFIVNWDLSLHKCTLALYDENEEIRKLNNVGCISEKGVPIIDNIKQAYWVGIKNQNGSCSECKLFPQCFGVGCAYRRLKGNSDDCRRKDLELLNQLMINENIEEAHL